MLGLNIVEDDLVDAGRLLSRIKSASEILRKAEENREMLAKATGIKTDILRDCNDGILSQDGTALYNEWRGIKAKWFLPRFFAKRGFIAKLKQFNSLIIEQEVDALLSNLLNYQ